MTGEGKGGEAKSGGEPKEIDEEENQSDGENVNMIDGEKMSLHGEDATDETVDQVSESVDVHDWVKVIDA